MSSERWTIFEHPQKAYRLEYPGHWECLEKDNAQSCGFGPRERDNVGLWISILPFSLDTDRLRADLRWVFKRSLGKTAAANIRTDTTLRHKALKADVTQPGEAGNYWIIAGGDLVLLASTQVPAAERTTWNPQFERVMASLQITRNDELMMRKIGDEVMERMRQANPEQNYQWEEGKIRGRDHIVYLGNVYREVLASPRRQGEIIGHFVNGLKVSSGVRMGYEPWAEVVGKLLPVPKPVAYVETESSARRAVRTEWLSGVIIVYAIRGELLRFVTDWDLTRWGIDAETLHQQAMDNLTQLPWPQRLEGSREPTGGRLILVATNDSFDASRLLHPDLHRLLSGPLGSPFLAGIPDRDTLVTCSTDPLLQRRIARKVREDYLTSAHPVTPRLFLVTPDGIELAGTSDTEDWVN
jgi:uncharacterized protein YtpQ (UPF0354 family)